MMDTTLIVFIVIAIIAHIINIVLTISALGRESEMAADNDPSVWDTSYLVYTCIGY